MNGLSCALCLSEECFMATVGRLLISPNKEDRSVEAGTKSSCRIFTHNLKTVRYFGLFFLLDYIDHFKYIMQSMPQLFIV